MIRSLPRLLGAALAAAVLVGAPAAVAQDSYPPMPAVSPPEAFALPQTETYALANGMKVTLIPYGLTPKTVVSLRLGVGNINDGDHTWLADVVSDMLVEGAGDLTGPQLAEAAAAMGGGLSTGVGMHDTRISLNVLSEHGPDAVALIADVARRPTFPESELGRVIESLQRSVAVSRSQAQGQAGAAMVATLYGQDHPYGRYFPTAEQLGGYTLDMVRAFHRDHYGARGAHLYIAGQYDPAAMRAAVEAAFADWAAGPAPLSLPVTANPGPRVVLVDRPGAAQSTLRLVFPGPSIGAEGDIPLRVTNTLLGGSFNSRITRNIREDKGYTYSPGSSLVFQDPRETQWVFNADVTTDVTGASLSEVFHEIRTLQAQPPSAAEASGARTYMAGIFVLQNAAAAGVLGSLAQRDLFGLPQDWLEAYVPSIMSVTPAQIRAAAASYLPLERATLVVVGDLATVRPQLEALPELQGAPFEVMEF